MPFTPGLLFSSLAIPTATLLLGTYLYDHPLAATKSRTIKAENVLSPSTAASNSIHLINPRNHQKITDNRSIILSRKEIGSLSDEEILARFTKGFFGGWIFMPERSVMAIFELFGSTAASRAGFSGVEAKGKPVSCFSSLPAGSMLTRQTPIIGGNFMILNYQFKSHSSSDVTPSFVEIAYGDDRKAFAGMHRFEIFEVSHENEEDERVEIGYSSISCNPKVDKPIFPIFNTNLVWGFHNFYALCLFRDGIREVLRRP